MPSTLSPTSAPRPSDRLARLGAKGRIDAYYEGRLDHAELSVWASIYPEEIPLVNDELPWIAASLADLD